MRNILFLLLISTSVMGQDIVYVNQVASGSNDGTSWANAYIDLQIALDIAQDDNQIWIARGTYSPDVVSNPDDSSFVITSGVSIYGGFAGTESSLSERDLASNMVILSGDINGDDIDNNFVANRSDNVKHVVHVPLIMTQRVQLHDLHIRHGHTGPDFVDNSNIYLGGGVLSFSAVTIANCSFSQNFGRAGASVALLGRGCNGSEVTNSTFRNNYGSQQSAGVFMNNLDGGLINECQFDNNDVARGCIYPLNSSNINITKCNIENNRCVSTTGFGCGIFVFNSQQITLNESSIANNTCGNGTGIYVDGRELPNETVNLNINNCSFSSNQAQDYGGGAIYSFKATLNVNSSKFDKNQGGNTGGAIYGSGTDKTIVFEDCEFDQNSAAGGWGGAITIHNDSTEVWIRSSRFTSNSAVTSGGALVTGFRTDMNIDDCYFEGNIAAFGAAIYSQNDSSSVSITNSEFAGNMASTSGGAIMTASADQHMISDCVFELNICNDAGGAVNMVDPDSEDRDTTHTMIRRCRFIENVAELQGGGINLGNSSATVINSLFQLNSARGDFGGAASINSTTTGYCNLLMINNTLEGNVAGQVSGVSAFTEGNGRSIFMAQNNISYHIAGTDYGVEDGNPEATSLGGNLVFDASLSNIFNGQNDLLNVDPLFVDRLGGDYCLMDLSPCVNNGLDLGAPTTDAFGNPRVGKVDQGFCENQNVVSANDEKEKPRNLSLVPNPVTDNTSLEIDWQGETTKISISIYDLQGKVIQIQSENLLPGQQKFEINASNLKSGEYMVECKGADIFGITRLLKI